jgi:hypothetical protein
MARMPPFNARKLTPAGQKAKDATHRTASAVALSALMAHRSCALLPTELSGECPCAWLIVRDGRPVQQHPAASS